MACLRRLLRQQVP
jgi:hypothetical protein